MRPPSKAPVALAALITTVQSCVTRCSHGLFGANRQCRLPGLGADHLEVAIARSRYGSLLNNADRLEEAIAQLEIAVDVILKEFGEVHNRTMFGRRELGKALHSAARDGEAIDMLSTSLDATAGPPDHLRYDRIRTLDTLADIHRDNGGADESQGLLEEAIGLWEAMGPLENPEFVWLDEAYAEALAARGDATSAAAHLRGRHESFAAEFGHEDEHTGQLADALAAFE